MDNMVYPNFMLITRTQDMFKLSYKVQNNALIHHNNFTPNYELIS